jgi:hypothetical protein
VQRRASHTRAYVSALARTHARRCVRKHERLEVSYDFVGAIFDSFERLHRSGNRKLQELFTGVSSTCDLEASSIFDSFLMVVFTVDIPQGFHYVLSLSVYSQPSDFFVAMTSISHILIMQVLGFTHVVHLVYLAFVTASGVIRLTIIGILAQRLL